MKTILNANDNKGGFSLIELMVVIGMIAGLTTLSIPAFNSITDANALNASASKVIDAMNLARQSAITLNRPVQIRFYQIKDLSGTDLSYRAIRLIQVDGSTLKDLAKVDYVDRNVILSDRPEYSTLIAAAPQFGTDSLPGNTTNLNYRMFQFMPDGSADLPAASGDSWFITLYLKRAVKNGLDGALPQNFITVQIDPVTGKARAYHP
ncbi:MAG: hypothetical protein B9S32_07995 [Verrucomicrobia bacterium Tous-C9LFEB]|nr:MAG: hypothetical protein B9S32_07995 [Verrucomicrobia bacterium Tous-C9LFEB]